MRADFAQAGWSLERDLGDRLRYSDAIALYESFATDPHTYSGATALDLTFPMSAADIVLLMQSGGSSLLGGITPARKDETATSPKPTAVEVREAESHMSSMFR